MAKTLPEDCGHLLELCVDSSKTQLHLVSQLPDIAPVRVHILYQAYKVAA